MKTDNTNLYANAPISKAIISLATPTIISQLITVVYNMADTFFIGQMNDPNKVAAATLAMPPFLLLTGIANLFGIGGSSLVSRSLGKGELKKAKSCSSFSFWSACILALLYGILILIFHPVILNILGCNKETYDFCYDYIFWTITIGAVPTVLNACLAHIIRSEGYSKIAGFGIAMGGILNIILDPIFIFVFRFEVAGAAIATMLSNTISLTFLLVFVYRKRKELVITCNPKYYSLKQGIPKEVVMVGLPSCVIIIMGIFSNTVLNNLFSSYSNEAIAGMGIAKKIDTLAFAISNGMTQGVISLIAYNYAAKNYKRMIKAIKTTFLYAFILALGGTVLLFAGAAPVMKFFIDNSDTVAFGQHFLRVICLTCPAISGTMIIITIFQAMGKKVQPLILSLLRKGSLDVPFMLLMNHIYGVDGIAWAVPISDMLVLTASVTLFIPTLKKLMKIIKEDSLPVSAS